MITDKQDLIRQRAYDLWVAEGRPEDRAEANWHQAEQDLSGALDDLPAGDGGPAESPAPTEPAAEASIEPFPETPRARVRRRKRA